MTWDVLYTDTFEHFMLQLGETAQVAVLADIEVLRVMGPSLGRPRVDAVKGSKYPNMKELRVRHQWHPYRIFFAFDPLRRVVLLCGARKDGAGNKRFYRDMLRIADAEYGQHLEALTTRS